MDGSQSLLFRSDSSLALRCRKGAIHPSFDHLVGKREQRRRNGKAEHSCGLGVEDQFELARPQDWKVSGLSASENTASIDAHLTIGLRQARAVTHRSEERRVGKGWRSEE